VLLTSLDPALLLFLLSLARLQSTSPANYDWEEGVDLYPSIHPFILTTNDWEGLDLSIHPSIPTTNDW